MPISTRAKLSRRSYARLRAQVLVPVFGKSGHVNDGEVSLILEKRWRRWLWKLRRSTSEPLVERWCRGGIRCPCPGRPVDPDRPIWKCNSTECPFCSLRAAANLLRRLHRAVAALGSYRLVLRTVELTRLRPALDDADGLRAALKTRIAARCVDCMKLRSPYLHGLSERVLALPDFDSGTWRICARQLVLTVDAAPPTRMFQWLRSADAQWSVYGAPLRRRELAGAAGWLEAPPRRLIRAEPCWLGAYLMARSGLHLRASAGALR